MPNDFYGLPLHPLVVHATVVVIPLAAVTVILFALWPRFRAWAGPLPMVLSLVGLFAVSLVGYGLHWRSVSGHSVARAVTVAVAVLAIVASVGTSVQVARIGHAGAKAAWADTNMSPGSPKPTD